MKLLFIGDVVGQNGCEALLKELPDIKRSLDAEIVIINGENSSEGNGISNSSAERLLSAGADVITTGNHCFRQKGMNWDGAYPVIRPANYGEDVPGNGVFILDRGAYSIAVINLMGTAFMQPLENPFHCIDRILEGCDSRVKIVDFHAEATSEKRAMGYYLAGRVTAVLGTHTHVPTADEQIINGTGYITDVGMTGAKESVLGVEKDIIIEHFLNFYPKHYKNAAGETEMNAVLLDIDIKTGCCVSVKRYRKIIR